MNGVLASVGWFVACAFSLASDDALSPEVFSGRRERLMEIVAADSKDAVAVLFAAPVRNRNPDVDYSYRQSSRFWYLTGFPEADAVALLERRDGKAFCTLFVPESNPQSELWTGRRLGVAGARPLADAVLGLRELAPELTRRLAGRSRVLVDWGGPDPEQSREDLLAKCLSKGVTAESDEPNEPDELGAAIGLLRLVKSPQEIALLQRAIDITGAALENAMRHAEPGMHEFELQAVIEGTYLLLGSPRIGFPSIVGSGRNSCILHYETNREPIPAERTIVLDVGAEYGMYSADVTRTLPSSGRFTPEQRVVYQAVLDAQKAGIAVAKPGATIAQINRAARIALSEALVRGDVVKNSQQALALLPHGVCHWLGLDVHDDCPYQDAEGRGEVKLAPGMVTTVEPGCYIPAGAPGIDARWHEIGVRIEDDVLITEDGCKVLSAATPREIDAIEALMAQASAFPRLLAPAKRP